VQAGSRNKSGKARPFFPSGSTIPRRPQGLAARRGGRTGVRTHAQGAESRAAQKDLRNKGSGGVLKAHHSDSAILQLVNELQTDIEMPFVTGRVWLSDLSMSHLVGSRPTGDRKLK
jgi:hypothetical protein